MMLGLFRKTDSRRLIERLHGEIVAAVRQPSLYADYGAADTFEGRYEVLALLAPLVTDRLAALEPPGPKLAQELTDAVFRHLDEALREMGVGDLAVPKRIKKLAEVYLGRAGAYRRALAAHDHSGLEDALSRNLYNGAFVFGAAELSRMARYAEAVAGALATTPLSTFEAGPLIFPDAFSIR